MASAKTVEEYLAKLPADRKKALSALRKIIKAAAPKATEKISWRMPFFYQDGMLIAYANFKDHMSLFAASSSTAEKMPEIKKYLSSKGTIKFTVDKPLPASIVKKLVKMRLQENKAKKAKRL